MHYNVNITDENNRSRNYFIDVSEESKMSEEETTELTPDTDPNLCYQIALAEYEHCIKRSERLDNKIYILLTICAFLFVSLKDAIDVISKLRYPELCCEVFFSSLYIIFTVFTALRMFFLLKGFISALSSIEIERFDSAEVMERDMVFEEKTRIVKYVIARYEEARDHNNLLIDKRYDILNKGVKNLMWIVVSLIAILILSNLLPHAQERTFLKYLYELSIVGLKKLFKFFCFS